VGETVGVGVGLSIDVGVGNSVGVGVGVGIGVGVGVGAVVGTIIASLGRSSKSEASVTRRVLVISLYLPVAKIRLPTNLLKSTFSGISKIIASDEEVTR